MDTEPPVSYHRITGAASGRRPHGFARCRSRGGARGFRLSSRRFSVSKLRAKFMCLLRILARWRRSIRRPAKPSPAEFPRCGDHRSGECRLRSFRRSNSFYAEAIAECLDFIKTKQNGLA